MNNDQSEAHIAELRRMLQELVNEAERRVANLEAELAEAKEVLKRMKGALADSQKPL
jgi:hypothetical protein